VPGTEHFRNIHRHRGDTDPALLTLRVDESLYFANARFWRIWCWTAFGRPGLRIWC
jgi:hypothetical protein